MKAEINKVVIVGGGSAGWLTAGVLASHFSDNNAGGLDIVLIESPDVKTIGVGEGTWPSMRSTLQKMNISETDFMRECDVSLKQGSRFNAWLDGSENYYYHPFSLPQDYSDLNLAEHWQAFRNQVSFTDAVSPQGKICDQGFAPKQISTPEFAFNVNYGYHLDAGKFATFLQGHCVDQLGITHIKDHVKAVHSNEDGEIDSLLTANNGSLKGDLFVDCTGFAAILIGDHCKVPFNDQRDALFNDSALVVQAPYSNENDPVASYTASTAQKSGWIWDIGLPTRRGIGYVYSSAHSSDNQAETELHHYLSSTLGHHKIETLSPRKIAINPGYRQEFWHKNCVAIGLSAGFVEPLEASALVLVELSAKMLAEQFPVNKEAMTVLSKRFNRKFSYRWQQIIDFLKLHYLLSQRQEDYWADNRQADSIPESLQESLTLWRTQPPWHHDTPHIDEMFPSASFQYVLYGMGFSTETGLIKTRNDDAIKKTIQTSFMKNQQRTEQLLNTLPTNRQLLEKVKQYGFQKI